MWSLNSIVLYFVYMSHHIDCLWEKKNEKRKKKFYPISIRKDIICFGYYYYFGWIIGPTNLSLEVEVQWESLKNKKGD